MLGLTKYASIDNINSVIDIINCHLEHDGKLYHLFFKKESFPRVSKSRKSKMIEIINPMLARAALDKGLFNHLCERVGNINYDSVKELEKKVKKLESENKELKEFALQIESFVKWIKDTKPFDVIGLRRLMKETIKCIVKSNKLLYTEDK